MYTKKGNSSQRSFYARRSLSIFLSILLSFNLLFAASVVYGKEALPPPAITLANYQAITIGMTKEEVVDLLGGEGSSEADRLIYKGAATDNDAVKQVEVSIDSGSNLVYQKKIQYAFKVLKVEGNEIKKWNVYTYSGKATMLTVPAYVSETVYLDVGGVEQTKQGEAIIYLDVDKKKLTALNVKKCIKLQWLTCDGNKLTKLDVTKNKFLWLLSCSYNRLSKINISQNTKLKVFQCHNNNLKKLNVTKNKKLLRLSCSKTSLKKINVTKNKKLEALYCYSNKIKKLNVTKNKELSELWCRNNKIKKLNVTKNKRLCILDCSKNSLKKINLKKNKHLSALFCYKNKINRLDVSKNKYLCLLEVDMRLPKSKLPRWLKNVKPIKQKGHWVYEYFPEWW